MNSKQLEGKTAVVTGAGGDIGMGICSVLAKEGASVVGVDIDEKAVQRAMEMVAKSTGGKVLAIKMDVTSNESINSAIKQINDKLGGTDVLVNNAGVITLSPLLDIPDRDWDFVMNVNAKGVFLCTKLFVKDMIRRKVGGIIVNISSAASKVPFPNEAHYNASKAAVNAITKASARELAPYNIRVNAICPGGVDAKMLKDVANYAAKNAKTSPNEIIKSVLSTISIGRLVKPEEIGQLVAFLSSDNSAAITGQLINIDGGDVAINS